MALIRIGGPRPDFVHDNDASAFADDRYELLRELALLPDEAFLIAVADLSSGLLNRSTHPREVRAGIDNLTSAARRYLQKKRTESGGGHASPAG